MTEDNKIRILIVEDEAVIALNIKLTLEDLGYEVIAMAHSYEEALDSIKTNEFDILLLDINLGNHLIDTGLDIATQLPALNIDKPFIFLTAFSDLDTIKKATKLKPSAYLVKPVGSRGLFAAIQTAFENYDNKKIASMPGEDHVVSNHFYTKVGKKMVKVLWSDVYAISSIKNYVKLVTPQNHSGYLIRSSLQQVLNKIVPPDLKDQYIQISRNTVILKECIKTMDNDIVCTIYEDFEIQKIYVTEVLKDLVTLSKT